jgi:DNA ligase-1
MLRREFLLLADTFKADKHDPVGQLMSIKLDGARALWDGGVSRGVPTTEVPWASLKDPKTGKTKGKIAPIATGLWSRYGNPIAAPDWFLDGLPEGFLMDGELYIGAGKFQQTMSAIRTDVPIDERWREVTYHAFGAPTFSSVFQSGLVKNANMLTQIDADECFRFIASKCGITDRMLADQEPRTFVEEQDALEEVLLHHRSHLAVRVPQFRCESFDHLDKFTKNVTNAGGEGAMLRDPDSVWLPKRKPFLLKCKPRPDSEATVVGFVAGREGKTGQLLGKLGTLVCVWHGDPTAPCGLLKAPVQFEIGTGLTHQDRELDPFELFEQARRNPGKQLDAPISTQPLDGSGTHRGFRLGDRVTFTYMGVSTDNVPREPAFIRVREDS